LRKVAAAVGNFLNRPLQTAEVMVGHAENGLDFAPGNKTPQLAGVTGVT